MARRGWWLIFVPLLVAASGAGWHFWRQQATVAAPQRPPAPSVPVKAAMVQRQDVPMYLDGIGIVSAFNTRTAVLWHDLI